MSGNQVGQSISGNTITLPKSTRNNTLEDFINNIIINGGLTVNDTNFIIQNAADNTKKARFDASLIAPSTLQVFSFPNNSGTLALISDIPLLQTGGPIVVASSVLTGFVGVPTTTVDFMRVDNVVTAGFRINGLSVPGATQQCTLSFILPTGGIANTANGAATLVYSTNVSEGGFNVLTSNSPSILVTGNNETANGLACTITGTVVYRF